MRLDKRVDEENVPINILPFLPMGPMGSDPSTTPKPGDPGMPVVPEPVAPDYPEHPLTPYLDPFGLRKYINPKYNPFMPGFFDPLFGRNEIEGESQPMRLNKRP